MARLGTQKLIGFAGTTDPARAKRFYRDVLGLKLVEENGFALVFDVGGVMLRVTTVGKVVKAEYTVLGWQVKEIVRMVKALGKAGVKFERFAGMGQDALGIWKAPSGAQVAWFKDPDGNVLSVMQE